VMVGRVLTITLLCFVAFLFVADPLACPDGCSRSHHDQQESSHDDGSAGGACVWCLGVCFEVTIRSVPRILTARDASEAIPAQPLVGSAQGIEHPPRS